MKNEIYVVNAYKWGERSNHSYTVGVFSKKHKAIETAKSHRDYRGGKYTCIVEKCVLNEFDNNVDDYTTTVYEANGYTLNKELVANNG